MPPPNDHEQPLAIETRALTKTFFVRGWLPGRPRAVVEALRGVDLAIPSGAIHGIIGPNGSGKSTLLRIFATLVLPDSGSAVVAGHDVLAESALIRRSIGFSAGDERSLYWRLTARQNLEFAAALYHVRDTEAAIARALRLVDLADAADRPVTGFSQGMNRRLVLGRALLHDPPLLLLDEPTRSLDPVARGHFQDVLRELQSQHATTVLLTTHDMGEAAEVCASVSVLQAGRIVGEVEHGDAREISAALERTNEDTAR